jgi:hypothetical protein
VLYHVCMLVRRLSRVPATLTATLTATVLALAVCVTAGCAESSPLRLPDGVAVSVHQNRPDTEDRRLQIRVSNSSDSPLTITRAAFSSPRFKETAVYPKSPTTVRAGGVVDLPISLPQPDCDSTTDTPRVEFTLKAAGRTGTVSVVPADPLGQLPGIFELDCLDEAVAAVVQLVQPDAVRTEQHGDRLVAMVDIQLRPTGAAGAVQIDSVDDTVLFSLFDPVRQVPLTNLPLGITIAGTDQPRTMTVPLVPARCEAHAVAEDKRGTLLPLRVDTGELSGIRYFPLSDALKGELYAYLGAACSSR